ncbi:hypothetical protein RHGRI_017289 [Rhododendron griersonianum]|uniref:Uncharacterized protein n=1 Tax=Rhododendron griersonianum TaxID=479676 RepID=A0AAV6JX95_9ERIC|nr:hypothetical protein RHGRI_017289 [Rhododendron griersonianum]
MKVSGRPEWYVCLITGGILLLKFPFLTVRRWGGDRIPPVFSATSRGGFLCSAYKVARQFSVLLFSVDD